MDYFQRFTAKVVDALGDLIPKWVTINEPIVYIFMRYLKGVFPSPQQTGWRAATRALQNLLRCHAAAYHTIKEKYPQAQVGVAKNMAPFEPSNAKSRLNSWWAGRVSWAFNDVWMEGMVNGRLPRPFPTKPIPNLADSFDFVGINYYTRYYVKFPPRKDIIEQEWQPDAIVSDDNYGEIYPDGLYQVIKNALRYNKPIYITENGVPDQADRLRPAFILNHLHKIWHAISFCFPIMGYYHWSLIDNFEWDRGWTQRFGLIGMDTETQTRHLRPSGQLYREICQSYRISSDMAARYAPELLSVMFPGDLPAKNEE